MANKPLQSIKFPGLNDTYTTPQVDATLTTTGAAADAKKVGDEITSVKQDLSKVFSNNAKAALLDCLKHVAWIDEHGQDCYDALEEALYSGLIVISITAAFNQSGAVITNLNNLSDLRQYLTVTALMDDGKTKVVNNYTLLGNLDQAQSTITVIYGEKTDTFTVSVTVYPIIKWDNSLGRLPSSEDGFTFNEVGNVAKSFDANTGIHLVVSDDNSRFEFIPTEYNAIKKGCLELIVTPVSIGNNTQIRFRLSNGTSGASFGMYELPEGNKFIYRIGQAVNHVVGAVALNEEYTIRVEYDQQGTNKGYVNNELVYSTSDFNEIYTTRCDMGFLFSCEVYIKSIKFVIQEV